MRIEQDGEYRTAEGKRVLILKRGRGTKPDWVWKGLVVGGGEIWFKEDGTCPHFPQYNVVAEWDEGPVVTVTRQEIIPGTYDGVVVSAPEHPDLASTAVLVSIRHLHLDADQLERAAAVLMALAGALRDGE